MTTEELITALFYEVDEQLHAIPKHPEAHLWPRARLGSHGAEQGVDLLATGPQLLGQDAQTG